MSAFLLALALLVGGDNRLWFVDLEVRGPCPEVRLDCGQDGETCLAGPFAEGEQRRLRLPVPMRSPLGPAGLQALPLPRSDSLHVRVLGWSPQQPAEGLLRALPGAFARPRPPVLGGAARAGWSELALVLVAGGLLLALRRRPWLALALGAGAGALALVLARGRVESQRSAVLIDWTAGETVALRLETGRGELSLPREWLEVSPEGARLELLLSLSAPDRGQARTSAGILVGLESVPAPALSAARNDAEALSEAWTRDAAGAWRVHGPWLLGEALGPAKPEDGPPPPGWATGSLPPGRSILLAHEAPASGSPERSKGGRWLRCLDFVPARGTAGD